MKIGTTFRRATQADASAMAEIHVAAWHEAYRGIVPDSTKQLPFGTVLSAVRYRKHLG